MCLNMLGIDVYTNYYILLYMKPLQFFNRVKMKVAIIPGNGAGDVFHANWYGWAHKQINKMENVSCDLRNMPDPITAKESIWIPFMREQMECDENTVIIGHSSGAEAAMRFAEKYKVKGIILVSGLIICILQKTIRLFFIFHFFGGGGDGGWKGGGVFTSVYFIPEIHTKNIKSRNGKPHENQAYILTCCPPAFFIHSSGNAKINVNVNYFQHVSLTWGMTTREQVDITAGPGTGRPSKPTQTSWCSLGPRTTPLSRGRSSKPWRTV